MDEDEREQTRDDVDIMREQIEHLEACLTASAKECAAKEAEIQRLPREFLQGIGELP